MTTHAAMTVHLTVHPDPNEVHVVDLTASHPDRADLVSLNNGDDDVNIAILGSLNQLEHWVAIAAAKLGQVRFTRRLVTEECAAGGAHTLSAVEHTDLGGTILECTALGCGGKFIQAGGRLCPVIPDVDGYIRVDGPMPDKGVS